MWRVSEAGPSRTLPRARRGRRSKAVTSGPMTELSPPPIGLLAELTHRCPLQCPYCSNPRQLEPARSELTTAQWCSVFAQAGTLGVEQVHLSGGEPASRRDLEAIVEAAVAAGLYTNLITSGVGLTEPRLQRLTAAGLDHVQLSIQDADAANSDRIASYAGGFQRKMEVAGHVRSLGLPLTLNVPVHRQNLDNLENIIALAVRLGALRIEIAHVQYYAWALANRAALMPTPEQVARSIEIVARARDRLKGVLSIDFVVPDYYARRPKPCMGGWGRGVINVTPSGRALPCHAAETIPGLVFETVIEKPLAEIWRSSTAFQAFRGTDWMREPCRSCEFRALDFGGCRCQALALTGNAANTDPACDKSPRHGDLAAMAAAASSGQPPPFQYRRS